MRAAAGGESGMGSLRAAILNATLMCALRLASRSRVREAVPWADAVLHDVPSLDGCTKPLPERGALNEALRIGVANWVGGGGNSGGE